MTAVTMPLLGVLGGMGPAATVDFLRKIVAATPAATDQDHVPVLASSIPQIPDRTQAFLGVGASPLDALVSQARRLVQAGAEALVMPCNTAHLWFEPLQAAIGVPMLHIVDSTLAELRPEVPGRMKHVGLLATSATLRSGLYVERSAALKRSNLVWHMPSWREVDNLVAPGIAAVKAGQLGEGAALLGAAARALQERGAEEIVLGCTEIPLVLDGRSDSIALVDATAALARCAVRWAKSRATRCTAA